jgi:enoyl-CoA hydratase
LYRRRVLGRRMGMVYETLMVEARGHVLTVTLNRPKVLNALNARVFDELEAVFSDGKTSEDVRVVVLTGAGERAFAAGADLKEMGSTDRVSGERLARRGQEVFNLIAGCGRPVIALVNGFALGGGCELAMACTMRIASEAARLGQPEVKLGLVPGWGGTQRLPRLVGRSAALKMMLTGEPVGAGEALRIGLVDEVVPAGELMARGEALARVIADGAPLAVHGCMEAVERGFELSLEDGLGVEAGVFGRLSGTEDKREGVGAFLEKRAARWVGR